MKAKKSGFSLVELICTLTIAAIIAVAAAPNVTAYIQNSKMQNYQTALNNLVGELQTKLPQTRYWNWQEVKDNAAEILGSDVARNVSEPEIDGTKCTYTLSNVSTDSDVQFKLSIDYGTPNLTKQDITISGECVGFDSVKSEGNTCTVLLKSNFVDKDNYPHLISTNRIPQDSSGWKPMKNMGGTYSYWEHYNLSNKDNDFAPTGEIPDKNSDAFYLNLTDYPAGACEQVIFTMQRYQVSADNDKTEIGYVDDGGNWIKVYNHNEGDIIASYYFIDNNGVKRTINWDPSWGNTTWYEGVQYEVKKDKEYTCIKREYNAFVPVYPRMQTQDAKGTGAQYAINSDYSNLEVCVGTDENGDDIWAKYSDVFNLSTYWMSDTPQADSYRSYYSDVLDLGEVKGAARLWSTDAGKDNIYIKYRVSDIPSSTRGWLYITGMVYGNQNGYINPVIDDTLQAYINYHRDAPDYDPSPILMATESGNFWNNYYKKLWLDISKCGYCVDNKLKITLKNVDANAVINASDLTVRCATPNMQAGSLQNLTDYGRDWLSSHTVNGNIVPTYDFNVNNSRFTFSEMVSVKKVNASTVELRIDATWDLYPYIYLYFPYANENFTFDMDLSMEWEDGDAEFSEETTSSNIPAVTVNGNDKYALLTFDWSKCDYITERNIGNMHLEFSQPLNYIVYSRDYTPLNYYTIYSKQYFYPVQIADSALKTSILDSEKLVHLYFDGISADEIKYQIKNCPSAPGTGEAPAPGAPDAPGTPIIPDAPAKPAPVEPDEPEEEVEEQSLTIHYIYAGKQYSKVYYDSFGSLNGQPSNVVTYTRNTDHNITFKKTDAILYFYPALGENDSPNSSDWMNISYDYIKTHNIHDLYIKGGIVYISNPDPNYVEYEVTLKREPLKSMCKYATSFIVHDKS